MSDNEWWKFCPVCEGCENSDDCDEPCVFAMSFLDGQIDG